MMYGTVEDSFIERRATVAVCQHRGQSGCFPPTGFLMHTATCRPIFPGNSLKL